MALEKQMPSEVEADLDVEQQHSHPVVIESNTDLDDDINEEVEESIQLSRKDILNSTNLDESLVMVKNLLSITSSLQKDDTADMLTKVYHKFLELAKERKVCLKLQANCY